MRNILVLTFIALNTLFGQDHWETAVFADDIWRYIVPDSEPPSNWKDQSSMIASGMKEKVVSAMVIMMMGP